MSRGAVQTLLRCIILSMFLSQNCFAQICDDSNEKIISAGVSNAINIWTARELFSRLPDFREGIYIKTTGVLAEEYQQYIFDAMSNKLVHVRYSSRAIAGYQHLDAYGKNVLIKEIDLSPQQIKEVNCLSKDIWLAKEAEIKRQEHYDNGEDDTSIADQPNTKIDHDLEQCEKKNRLTKDFIRCRDAFLKTHPFVPPPKQTLPSMPDVGHDHFQFIYLIKNENVLSDSLSVADEKTKRLYRYVVDFFDQAQPRASETAQ